MSWIERERNMDKLLYGVAYYDEYMPYDRLDKDVEMMKAAGINVVRIAESTWSTLEPKPGVYNFEHIDRVLDAMEKAGIPHLLIEVEHEVVSLQALKTRIEAFVEMQSMQTA